MSTSCCSVNSSSGSIVLPVFSLKVSQCRDFNAGLARAWGTEATLNLTLGGRFMQRQVRSTRTNEPTRPKHVLQEYRIAAPFVDVCPRAHRVSPVPTWLGNHREYGQPPAHFQRLQQPCQGLPVYNIKTCGGACQLTEKGGLGCGLT